MEINLKNIKLFSTAQEREELEQKQILKDSDFGNPKTELARMYNATQWGIYFFACVTLLSTAALIYRVTFPHVAELLGTAIANISMLILAVGAAMAIEIMLRGNWEPALKKLFVTGKIDIILFGLGIIFTGIILYGAITGMEIIADGNTGSPTIESILATSEKTNATIDKNKQEIDLLTAGKGKGVYAWQGKPTPQAKNRIKDLEAQNTAALSAIASIAKTTEQANTSRITTFNQKQAKAVHYLSILAIGAESIKLIIFTFWGYRCKQLKIFTPGPSQPQPSPLPQNPTPVVKQQGTAKTDNSAIEVYKNALNYRSTLQTRFKEHFLQNRHKYETLSHQWDTNEDRLFQACTELGKQYDDPNLPRKEDYLTNA